MTRIVTAHGRQRIAAAMTGARRGRVRAVGHLIALLAGIELVPHVRSLGATPVGVPASGLLASVVRHRAAGRRLPESRTSAARAGTAATRGIAPTGSDPTAVMGAGRAAVIAVTTEMIVTVRLERALAAMTGVVPTETGAPALVGRTRGARATVRTDRRVLRPPGAVLPGRVLPGPAEVVQAEGVRARGGLATELMLALRGGPIVAALLVTERAETAIEIVHNGPNPRVRRTLPRSGSTKAVRTARRARGRWSQQSGVRLLNA